MSPYRSCPKFSFWAFHVPRSWCMAGPSDSAQVHGQRHSQLSRSTTGLSLKTPVLNTSTQMLGARMCSELHRCRRSWDFLRVTRVHCGRTCQSSRSFGYFAALYRVVPEALLHLAAFCCLVILCLASLVLCPQAPPNTTTPPPPEVEEDTGLGLPAIIAIASCPSCQSRSNRRHQKASLNLLKLDISEVVGGAICLGGGVAGIYVQSIAIEPTRHSKTLFFKLICLRCGISPGGRVFGPSLGEEKHTKKTHRLNYITY